MTGYRGRIGYGTFNASQRKFRCLMAPQCALQFGPFASVCWPEEKKMFGIKLPDNCYLFECNQCAVCVPITIMKMKYEIHFQCDRLEWFPIFCFFFFLKNNLRWNVTSYHTCIAHNHINLWCALRCGIFEHLTWTRTCISSRKMSWRKNCSHNCIIGYKSWERANLNRPFRNCFYWK